MHDKVHAVADMVRTFDQGAGDELPPDRSNSYAP